MQFGKIEYLNLLPFYIYLKRREPASRFQMSLRYHKGVPSKINRDFKRRRIDAAFISSIAARGHRHTKLGIVAREEVLSVLLVPGDSAVADAASATSNRLANLLGLTGEVLIGDRALRHYLAGKGGIDLAALWHERTGLPFVFAVLCHHGHGSYFDALATDFLRHPVKIPRYLLHKAACETGISPDAILHYLKFISYRLDGKALRGLKSFYRLDAASRANNPRKRPI